MEKIDYCKDDLYELIHRLITGEINEIDFSDEYYATGKLIYSVEFSSCVTHTSMALNLSGIFNIGIHPYLLNAQMYLWSNGLRPWNFSYFLNQQK